MPDQVNSVVAYTFKNQVSTTTETITSIAIDLSPFENGVTIAWQLVVHDDNSSPPGPIVEIIPEELDENGGPFVAISTNRLIGSDFFNTEFGKDKLFTLDQPTTGGTAVSYFQILDLKRFLRIKLDTTVAAGQSVQILVNLFGRAEISPVLDNSITFTIVSP